MKNIKYSFLLLISLSFNQDIVGQYRLTGLSAVDYDFARYDTDIIITEQSDIGLNLIGDTFKQGEIIEYAYQIPVNEAFLYFSGVALNVTFTENGMAMITEGSSYPTAVLENCVTIVGALPITGEQGYASDLNSNTTIPSHDILGLPSMSPYKNLPSGSISISQSQVFDLIPATPQNLMIPFPIDTASVFGRDENMIPPNTILPGVTAGYVIKSTEMLTMHNIAGYLYRPSLYFEWHAMDGEVNESGFGESLDIDEDEDGTDFDGIFGLSSIRVTKINLECNTDLDNLIAGDKKDELKQIHYDICMNENLSEDCMLYSETWIEDCIDESITSANSGQELYAIDPNYTIHNNPIWKGIYTWNSHQFHLTNDSEYLVDDTGYNFDGNCLEENISTCKGKFIFNFTPQCIQSFNVRHFMVEMTEECENNEEDKCGVCFGSGEVTWYLDQDNDGLGDPSNTSVGCLPPCNDSDGDDYCDERYVNNNFDTCIPGEIDECGECNGDGPEDGFDCLGNDLSINDHFNFPNSINISNAFPNPFNPNVNIEITSNDIKNIELDIINVRGEQVSQLFSGNIYAGKTNFSWNANPTLPSGIYLIRLESFNIVSTKKILLIK